MKKVNTMFNTMFILLLFAGPVMADATIKVGGNPGTDTVNSLMLSVQPERCGTCLSPYFIRLSTDYGKYDGIGVDLKHEFLKRERDTFTVSFGPVSFRDRLNNSSRLQFHASLGFEIKTTENSAVVLSYDAYDPLKHALDRDVQDTGTVHTVNIGLRFK